jgi:hypothetical protein
VYFNFRMVKNSSQFNVHIKYFIEYNFTIFLEFQQIYEHIFHSVIFSSLSRFSNYGHRENTKSVSRKESLQNLGTLSVSLSV